MKSLARVVAFSFVALFAFASFGALPSRAGGIQATDPNSLEQSEKILQARIKEPASLKAHLADQKTLLGFFLANRVQPNDAEQMAAAAIAENKDPLPVPAAFQATRAFTEVSFLATDAAVATEYRVTFVDAKSQLVVMAWATVYPAKKALLLNWPLHEDDADALAELQKKVRDGDATYLEKKKNGVWADATLPPPLTKTCMQELQRVAKAVYVAEESLRAETDAYSTDPKQLGLTAHDEDGVKLTFKTASATAFSAVLEKNGGRVTIDQTGTPVEAAPCSP